LAGNPPHTSAYTTSGGRDGYFSVWEPTARVNYLYCSHNCGVMIFGNSDQTKLPLFREALALLFRVHWVIGKASAL